MRHPSFIAHIQFRCCSGWTNYILVAKVNLIKRLYRILCCIQKGTHNFSLKLLKRDMIIDCIWKSMWVYASLVFLRFYSKNCQCLFGTFYEFKSKFLVSIVCQVCYGIFVYIQPSDSASAQRRKLNIGSIIIIDGHWSHLSMMICFINLV